MAKGKKPDFSETSPAHVDWKVFAKMYAKDYEPRPFYFVQTSPKGVVRMSCWCSNPEYIWKIAETVISHFPDRIAVLMKVESGDNEGDGWERFHNGNVSKAELLAAVHRYSDYVLGDASVEIAVKRSDTGEYVVLDCAGALWIYPADDGKQWITYLEQCGFPLEYRESIKDVFHWNRTADQADEMRRGLILDLKLEPA